MWLIRRFVVLVLALGSAGEVLAGQLTLIDQTRFVSTLAEVCSEPSVGDSAEATDFEVFRELVRAHNNCIDGTAWGFASQTSALGDSVLVARGESIAQTVRENFNFILSIARSDYAVEFSLDESTVVGVVGLISAAAAADVFASFQAGVTVKLVSGADVLFEQTLFAALNEPPVQSNVLDAIVLPAGTYQFSVMANATVTDAIPASGRFEASYELVLRALN